ncbi:unknown [[Mannheimia] succiniciproducens MBEL55E]|uniref:Uncharacterized protein n=1 Tax=Mannheimia succiniciproducens (strain KCTC 0769BP / MBEL55E) TaxID=221988 RepID=Q65S30_MANSM|nr:unknown [[Mannheimia] succiniciproducens MBEL55E]
MWLIRIVYLQNSIFKIQFCFIRANDCRHIKACD